ncbi:hypothetical protein QTL95_21360 [Rhizobium sp. S152]|uniref:hypothetical protein n=1 Tax=Rhizobium sp. S152 TaxID=3055038 RepID=UPI0025AA1C2D|nr:hypothetical protein [Rhizobium sp. S152]MDM9628448.1 hypothetical protein [Rhizobium sp. S152]
MAHHIWPGISLSAEAVKAYVDRLLQEGFSVDVTDADVVIIIDPDKMKSLVNARDPRRGIDLRMHKKSAVDFLRQLGRTV